MKADKIDIQHHTSNHIDEYVSIPFNYVITVCDNAKERCPFFPTKALKVHYNFPDPAQATGSEAEIMTSFESVRDLIKNFTKHFVEIHHLGMGFN
jgi:arsenate reductase